MSDLSTISTEELAAEMARRGAAYSAREIERAVESRADDSWGDGWDDLAYLEDGHKFTLTVRGESVEAEVVATDPGGEGHGEDVSLVIKVGDQLFEKTGYYASHDGTHWDGSLTEVHPVQKTVTVYERVRAA